MKIKTYVKQISKIDVLGTLMYRVELKSGFSFDFSGSSITILNTISDLRKSLKHVVFCDGS